jgi:hypothetical protein
MACFSKAESIREKKAPKDARKERTIGWMWNSAILGWRLRILSDKALALIQGDA